MTDDTKTEGKDANPWFHQQSRSGDYCLVQSNHLPLLSLDGKRKNIRYFLFIKLQIKVNKSVFKGPARPPAVLEKLSLRKGKEVKPFGAQQLPLFMKINLQIPE